MRERIEQHRSKPTCMGCHGVMDPLGFALENFDTIGQYHTHDAEAQALIDTSGVLPDGTPIKGPDDLRRALVARPDQFVQAFTENLFTYALGRSIDYRDMPTVRKIVRGAEADNYRFESIVLGIISTDAFRKREASERKPSICEVGVNADWRNRKVMFLTRKHLSRRTLLKGAGASIALPLLDAMIPAQYGIGANRCKARYRDWASFTFLMALFKTNGSPSRPAAISSFHLS